MNDMWGALSSPGELFLNNVDIPKLKKPIDSNDDREEALGNASMPAIAAAAEDKDYFMTLTETYFVFSEGVNRAHAWFTGCPCHDYIWMSDQRAEAEQTQFEAETACTACWRLGRRGSELARGYARKLCEDVMVANSKRLQRRLRVLDSDRRIGLLHSLERMQRGWTEEIADKLLYWEHLPMLLLGVWPKDDQSQVIAGRCLSELNLSVAQGTSDTPCGAPQGVPGTPVPASRPAAARWHTKHRRTHGMVQTPPWGAAAGRAPPHGTCVCVCVRVCVCARAHASVRACLRARQWGS